MATATTTATQEATLPEGGWVSLSKVSYLSGMNANILERKAEAEDVELVQDPRLRYYLRRSDVPGP
jgi:hypothetical protein